MSTTTWDPTLVALTAAGGPVSPLFFAEVDAVDPSAVLSLMAILPNEDGSGLRSFERKGGGWVEAPAFIKDLSGITPPPVVELDRETLLAVLEQIDSYDSKNPEEEE